MYHEIMDELTVLEVTLSALKNRGTKLAEAEQEYKIALAKEMLSLQEKGQKVTIMRDLCYGTPHIAALRLDRDIADTMYRSCLEAINIKKLKIRIMEAQYDREYKG